MTHYAFLDENNIVTEVIVGKDENKLIEGKDPETWYGEFRGQVCKRTSYNTIGGIHYDPFTNNVDNNVAFRKNYAGIGYSYNSELDAFIPPKPFNSWILDQASCLWEAPVPMPADGKDYAWNEELQSWDVIKQQLYE
jgi:hypothetical protein